MDTILRSNRLNQVYSDIRGPLYHQALELQAQGVEILKLNIGNPAEFGFKMPESVRNALLENMDRAVGYSFYKGMADAREAICEYHREKGLHGITPEDIFIGNGVSELVPLALNCLLNSGDEVLIPAPSYALWGNSTRIAGGTPVFYRCDEASGWHPDTDHIRARITSKTKALVIINPNNPTGALYPKEVLESLVKIAEDYHLTIFSDEIYDRLILEGLEHISTASLNPRTLVITMNGLSKSHFICGFRCGWMVVSGAKEHAQDLMEGFVQMTSMRLCPNVLSQIVIPAALADTESTKSTVRPGGRFYQQREATIRVLSKIPGISFIKNSAAFYLFPKLDVKQFGISDDRQFARDLLQQAQILVVPGSGFDWDAPDHFRIVMLPEPEILEKAMQKIADFLKTYYQE